MAASGSDTSDRAAVVSQLGSLSNPELADLPAAELAVHLYSHRCASDFADVVLVLAEVEAQICRDGEKEARLLAEIRAWERRATKAEAELLLRAGVVREPERAAAAAAARVSEQEEAEADEVVGVHASRDSEMEVTPPDCTPSAINEAAGVLAVPAEAGDVIVPRLR